MNFLAFATTLFCFVQVTLVNAHGSVSRFTANGKAFPGPNPFSNKNPDSPVRKISTTFPITNVNSQDMTCGINAKPAALVASVKAGSDVTFAWESGKGRNWGHSIGPIMTYMAKCDGPCKSFNPAKAKFFKISQVGRKSNSMEWVQAGIKQGKTFTTKVPAELPDGEYLIRHELIALHFATKRNGAQFYPSCIQVKVTGGQGKALPTETVSFPGAYKASDPGIFTPNVFTKRDYVFPGPQVAKFGSAFRAVAAVTNSTNLASNPGNTTASKAQIHARRGKHMVRSRIMRDLPSESLNHQ